MAEDEPEPMVTHTPAELIQSILTDVADINLLIAYDIPPRIMNRLLVIAIMTSNVAAIMHDEAGKRCVGPQIMATAEKHRAAAKKLDTKTQSFQLALDQLFDGVTEGHNQRGSPNKAESKAPINAEPRENF
ncbi:hypothetical protein IFR05_008416 [Cadophora sp. M221]|nr:hypothetical protein IFR05_008416 [Cadophora sp. M221]